MPKMPPLRALQAFEAFGRHGTVVAAAAELGVTPGAVSQQLRNVEAYLGVHLVTRRGNLVSLTTLGRAYHSELFAGFEKLRNAQSSVARALSGTGIVISCLPSLTKWLGPIILDWQDEHRDSAVKLVGSEAENEPGSGAADFRVSYGARKRHHAMYIELFHDIAVPACSPDFLRQNNISTPADLIRLPHFTIRWESDHVSPPSWSEWADAWGVYYSDSSAETVFTLSSAAIDAAVSGRGIALAQLSMITNDLEFGRLVIPFHYPVKLKESYFLAWDSSAMEKRYGTEFRDWLISIARNRQKFTYAKFARSMSELSEPRYEDLSG